MRLAACFYLALSIFGTAQADCDLRYAPPDVRSAAMAFHYSTFERRANHSHSSGGDKGNRGARVKAVRIHALQPVS